MTTWEEIEMVRAVHDFVEIHIHRPKGARLYGWRLFDMRDGELITWGPGQRDLEATKEEAIKVADEYIQDPSLGAVQTKGSM